MDESAAAEELKRILQLFPEFNKQIEEFLKSTAKTESTNRTALLIAKGLAAARTAEKKSVEEITKEIKDLNEKVKNGTITFDELETELEKMRQHAAKAIKEDDRNAILKSKAALEKVALDEKTSKIFGEATGKATVAVGSGFVTAITSAASAAMAGSDAMQISANFMKDSISAMNQGIQAGTGGIKALGESASLAGKKWGIAVQLGASLLGAAASKSAELMSKAIDMQLTAAKDMMAQYKIMASVGAIYSGGVEAMTRTALNAGMTLDQFAKATSTSRDALSKTGLGVAEASKRMAAAMNEGGKSARMGMFALGMSMEEQATATAETMARMAGPSGQLKASNAEIATRTFEYAKNLRQISDLTGQDAKARMEKVRQDNDTLAFGSYMNSLSAEQRDATEKAMAMMSESDAKAFREKQIYGAVISTDLAASRAMNAGIAKAQDEQWDAAQRGALNAELVAKGYERHGEETAKINMQLGQTVGKALSGSGVDISKALHEQGRHQVKFADSTKRMAEIAAEGAEGKAGKSTVANLEEINQTMKTTMADITLTALPSFSKALEATSASMIEITKKLATASVEVGNAAGSIGGSLLGGLTTVLGAAGSLATGAALMGSMKSSKPITEIVGPPAPGGGGAKGAGGLLKAGGKGLLKAIPGLGLALSLVGGASRAMAGDFTGAGMEIGAGAMGMLPGFGTMGSIGMSAALAARDMGMMGSEGSSATPTTTTAEQSTSESPILSEIKQTNEHLAEQEKGLSDLKDLMQRLLETSERHLTVADYAAKNAA